MSDMIWPELVFHVLAHLEDTAHLPSSLFDRAYVEMAKAQLGPVSGRALGKDLMVLSAQLTSHERLSRVQLIARLHPDLASAVRTARFDLSSLHGDGNTDLRVRDQLIRHCALEAELLRCAALLEADHFLRWPLPDLDAVARELEREIQHFLPVAPWLRSMRVRPLRVLGPRGRAFGDEIWVGIPNLTSHPSMAHVLCQAAHEATVVEVDARSHANQRTFSEREVEQIAVALFARRASNSNLAVSHRDWLSRWSPEVQTWAAARGLSDPCLAFLNWMEPLWRASV
ncbi:MAG: hypothetical protein ACM3ZE_30530 [Myxococcales bacterium]